MCEYAALKPPCTILRIRTQELTNLLSYFKKVNDSHNHNIRNNTLSFKVKFRRTSKKAFSICIKGCKMWNALSPDIKLSRNANAFKKMLKSSLLEDYKFRSV